MQYGDSNEHSLTMMQQLQAERRQRFMQFQKRKKGRPENKIILIMHFFTLFYPGRQSTVKYVVCSVNRFEIGSLT